MLIRTAARRLHALQRRSLSTSVEAPGRSNDRRPPVTKTWYPEENLKSLHPRMIFVRPWDGLPTMVHAFAIVREIERRFGKIQEFVVLRDSDVLTSNMPYMHATFARAEYADAIPLEGRVIQVANPLTNSLRSGGVGLDDLELYLDPTTRAEALSSDSGKQESGKQREWGPKEGGNFMDVKLERSGMRDPPPALDLALTNKMRMRIPDHKRNPARAKELGEAMLAFGGFSDAPSDQVGGRTRMQTAMSRWGWKAGNVTKTEPVQEELAPAEEVSWTPFTLVDDAAPPSSPDIVPPAAPLADPPTVTPAPLLKSKSNSPVPKPKPATPTLPKKQRLLLAARSAGAMAAKENDDSRTAVHDDGSTSDASVTSTDETDVQAASPLHDSAARDKENKQAARKWWAFLTGGKG